MPDGLGTPWFGTSSDSEDCPNETYDPPKRRIFEAELLTQVNEMVLNEDDDCLPKEKDESSVVFKGPVYEHRTAAMDDCRNPEADEQLEVLRCE
jgi:hypothetical protein